VRPSLRAALLERSARRGSRRAGAVLVYHGIGTRGGAAALLAAEVPPAAFTRQLAFLAERFRVVPLAELVDAVAARGRGERFPVAITFDDDLASHTETAAPALRAARLPATFFLTGASLEQPQPFWWDDLAQVIDTGALAPERIQALPAALVDAARTGASGGVAALARAVEQLEPERRAGLARVLRDLAGAPGERGLRTEDVRGLVRSGFEIGFHTRRHDPPVSLDDEAVAAAFQDGRDALEAVAETPLERLAYPHGRADGRVATFARDAGFVEAYTGAAAPVLPDADPFLLPRYQAPTSLEALSMQLALALSGRRRR
jgi:peptidoglycan/xylan/chitin deacetylase (PgdA/CDA1 family)